MPDTHDLDDGVRISQFVRPTLRRWWVIALITVGAMAWAILFSRLQTPVYRAVSTFLVMPADNVISSSNEAVINSINTLRGSATTLNTFAEIATSKSVAQAAGSARGLTPEEMAESVVTAVVLPETFAIQIAVEGPDAVKAAALANAVRDEAGQLGAQAYPAFKVRPLDEALPPPIPARPQPVRDVSLAGVGGLALGLIVAFCMAYMSFMGAQRPTEAQPEADESVRPTSRPTAAAAATASH